MIIYKKNIEKWKFWRKKSKLTFCLVSGFFYATLVFLGGIPIRLLLGKSDAIIENSFYGAIGALIPAIFLSIAIWYENEKRYKKWELDNKEKK